MSESQHVELVVDRIAEMLGKQVGLRSEPTLRGRLRRCIQDEATLYGQDLDTYLETVRAHQDVRQSLLNRVTVQETAFFRHPEHFQVLAHELLPKLSGPVRIWSAACANGQEAYSLAMLMAEMNIDGTVIATDLSTAALRRTTAGRYAARELTGLSPERIARHLTRDGDGWAINKSITDRVITMRHNLIDPIPDAVAGCQVVFCRNVLIYFSPEHASAFLDNLADRLPTAAVFLGSAETMWSISERFAAVRLQGTFFYRLREQVRSSTVENSSPAGSRPTAAVPVRAAGKPIARTTPGALPKPVETDDDAAVRLAAAGERASAAGDHRSAVIAFRKCAYLVPDDAVAHLHLGLSLESSGDNPSAQRAFGAARALVNADPQHLRYAIGGYTAAELLRLLDTKTKPGVAP